jgi:hypothetical protein
MWGSLGWAMAASVSGLLFNFTPLANFLLSSSTSLLMLLVLISLKIGDEQLRNNSVISANKIVFSDVMQLLKSRKFWMFSLYVAGVAWMMFIAEQQFPRYFVSFLPPKSRECLVRLSQHRAVRDGIRDDDVHSAAGESLRRKAGAAVLRLRCRGQADRLGLDQRSGDHLDYQTVLWRRNRAVADFGL